MPSMKKIRENIQVKFFLRNKNYRFVIIKVKTKIRKIYNYFISIIVNKVKQSCHYKKNRCLE
jgi:hypothetical protein